MRTRAVGAGEPRPRQLRSAMRAKPEGSARQIDIPELDLSAVVFEGTSDEIKLARGVGHLRGSAGPGERGKLQ